MRLACAPRFRRCGSRSLLAAVLGRPKPRNLSHGQERENKEATHGRSGRTHTTQPHIAAWERPSDTPWTQEQRDGAGHGFSATTAKNPRRGEARAGCFPALLAPAKTQTCTGVLEGLCPP
ncbi:hypothetical protein A0H81_05988 [Grifola frondosa]|uniref:Uncharacterized protein n=1 Tax=Grifola frondosa TaxID=5627 RepID=A0A1C7MG41_GRIFR|nr:hypothetical protein A0H81_05988 [Grifola frondosa]